MYSSRAPRNRGILLARRPSVSRRAILTISPGAKRSPRALKAKSYIALLFFLSSSTMRWSRASRIWPGKGWIPPLVQEMNLDSGTVRTPSFSTDSSTITLSRLGMR